jgi:UDP-hydrolysing UDP-N-acetyl-D-glucosamine 2-epimerase
MLATMSNAFAEIPDTLNKLQPDLALVLGDRYEIFAAASICRLSGIRLAHIAGGELTIGAFDDCLRHCITKLSDLHFTAAEEFSKRVIQLGEAPDRVFNVGELGFADLQLTSFKTRSELEELVGVNLDNFFLMTIHPETCSPGQGIKIFHHLAHLFSAIFSDYSLVFTAANADPEGDQINDAITAYININKKARFIRSLGRLNYLSMARLASCVIGNSSSGLTEVPALGTPVINIGRRQTGRPHGASVISVPVDETQICEAIKKALHPDLKNECQRLSEKFSGFDSARMIARIISDYDLSCISQEKEFNDL